MTSDHLGVTMLPTNECLDLLRSQVVGRLAVSIDHYPDIFPLNYVVDHGTIVFRTAEGTKLSAAVRGRAVAFEADGLDPTTGEAWSVVAKGEAVEIESLDELFEATELPLYSWHAAPKHRFVRIEPTEISGRRFHIVDGSPRGGARDSAMRAAPE